MAYIASTALNAMWRRASQLDGGVSAEGIKQTLNPPKCIDCGCEEDMHYGRDGHCMEDDRGGYDEVAGGCRCTGFRTGYEPEAIATIYRGRVIFNGDDELCSWCGKPGADKIPAPTQYPGEYVPESKYIHAECEDIYVSEAFEDHMEGRPPEARHTTAPPWSA